MKDQPGTLQQQQPEIPAPQQQAPLAKTECDFVKALAGPGISKSHASDSRIDRTARL